MEDSDNISTDKSKAAEKHGEPLVSSPLQACGISKAEGLGALPTLEQWIRFHYLHAWIPPFFLHTSRDAGDAAERRKNGENTGSKCGKLSLRGLMECYKFPIVPSVVPLWEGNHQSHGDVAQEVRALLDGGAVNRQDFYSQLPRVVESTVGRVLRSSAVHQYVSSRLASCNDSPHEALYRLVRQTLEIVHGRSGVGKLGAEATGRGEAVLRIALETMLSPDNRTSESAGYHVLFDMERAVNGSSNVEANVARLFTALAVEVFGRVKSVCAALLLAHINQINAAEHASARSYGVVAGVMEYAMAYRHCRDDSTGRCPITSAALLLHHMVELQQRMEEDGGGTTVVVPASLLATTVVACTQELLFATIAGGAAEQQQQQVKHGEMVVRPTVARGLALHEVDALLQVFLPVLLQQVGFEWPWSESLRRARALDRSQQQQAVPASVVRLDSQAVFGELLTALSRRTYGLRLRAILPQSFDTIMDSLFPPNTRDVVNEEDGAGSSTVSRRQANGSSPRFLMPSYYRVAGESLIEHFERCGLSGTTADEAERVLKRTTDVQPMIVQLLALGDGARENTHDCDRLGTNPLRTVRLSEAEKKRLLLRYRCEVLLASIVVYTQLKTVSVVQQLTRQLAPLFEKLLLPLLNGRTLGRCPVLTQSEESSFDDVADSSIDFTPEFKVLMDEIRYEFYPLEWVPDAVNAHIHRQSGAQRLGSGARHDEECGAPCVGHYSVFAAVAYQFGLRLEGSPRGLSGGDGSGWTTRAKAYRFFTLMMLNNLADAITSSCDLEGAMALRATRRVGGNRNDPGVNSTSCANQQPFLLQRGSASFHSVVGARDTVLTLAQCLLPPSLSSQPTVEGDRCVSSEWMRRVVEWTQSMRTKYVTRQEQAFTRSPDTAAPLSLCLLFNSFTFDSVPLARELIRSVWRRLLEKTHVVAALSVEGNGGFAAERLLKQHLYSFTAALSAIGLLPPTTREGCDVLSSEKLLWASPLFSDELRRCGRYEVGM
ncbi:unnamed protein product [Trypanosoma congolense IL3000]|uniref:WGS project CAEQ00000000 data, annotated contig 548 n=1 Tax=Trypanosoma congolense (strain IL3000) TaxID=1068625 RepID=F9WGT7_TRYCI|nr:unnamed protein product [Trypanosoma congolense IL3000]